MRIGARLSGLLLLVVVPLLPAADQAVGWHAELRPAIREAEGSGLHHLVIFTGLDWQEESRKLRDEVLGEADFAAGLDGDFVVTRVDLPRTPRDEESLPELEKRQYLLAREFRVHVLPALFLCTPDGRPYAMAEYAGGGAEALLGELQGARRRYVRISERAGETRGGERARRLEALLESIPEPLRARHRDTMEAIVAADPDDETGLRTKYRLELSLPEARDLRYRGRLDESEKLYLSLIDELRPSGTRLQDLYYELGDVYFQRKDYDRLLAVLDRALAAAPESPRVPVIEEMFGVFTRQWVFSRWKPEEMREVEYDWKKIEIGPDDRDDLSGKIDEALGEVPGSRRNRVLEEMKAELRDDSRENAGGGD